MVKILIVDDSRFSQKITASLIKQYLTDAVFEFAGDGEEGLEKFMTWHPGYMIIDLLMPKLRGQDMIEKVKEQDIDAKVFVVSADVQKRVRDVIDKMGVLSFINKPLDEEKAKKICDIIRNDAR